MILSLQARLLLASSAVLVAFLGITGLVLDRAFHDSAETALRDRLQGHVYALLSASDLDKEGELHLPIELPDPRFSLIDSGLYAEVVDSKLNPVWRSRSLIGRTIAFPDPPPVGQRELKSLSTETGAPLLSLSFTINWETSATGERLYTYRVAENLVSFNEQIAHFRRSLWGWLAGAALLLLLAQSAVLRWSLTPLRRVADDLRAIEAGLRQRLNNDYPRELRQLTDNLNGLLISADSHLKRYRDALGNLSHSLKTPVAVLRGAVDSEKEEAVLRQVARTQLENMAYLIERQLHRAALAGRAALTTPVDIKPIVENIVSAMTKVYADKAMNVTLVLDSNARFLGDAGDLMEMLGNLLDNAFKWSRGQVRVRAQPTTLHAGLRAALEITVEDDGPGLAEALRAEVLKRGIRADESTPGHGLGLAMVQDNVAVYQGELRLETSVLGGLLVCLLFPAVHSAAGEDAITSRKSLP